MMDDITYAEAIKNAEHFIAIGQTEISLWQSEEKPWDKVTEIRPGGGHRLNIATSVSVTAKDPASGLKFRWSCDTEHRSANGKGCYEINVPLCKQIMGDLKGVTKEQFAKYLADFVAALRANAAEYFEIVARERREADVIEDLIAG